VPVRGIPIIRSCRTTFVLGDAPLFTIASYGAAVAGGTTILLTTHNLEKAAALADRVAIIAVGRLVAVDSPERLTAQANSAATVRWVDGDEIRVEQTIHPTGLIRQLSTDGRNWLS